MSNEQLSALTKAIQSEIPNDVDSAARALAEGEQRSVAVDVILSALQDAKCRIRNHLAQTLGKLYEKDRPEDGRILDSLLLAVSRKEVHDAGRILAELHDARVLEPLVRHLAECRDYDLYAEEAAYALGQLGDRRAVDALSSAVRNKALDWRIRGKAAIALAKLGDIEAVVTLLPLLDDENEAIRSDAAESLGQLGNRNAVNRLVASLNDSSDMVRRSAAQALGLLGDKTATAALVKALGDSDSGLRNCAAAALGAIGDREAVPELISLVRRDSKSMGSAAEALGNIGDERAIETLRALKCSDEYDRQRVVDAIEKLSGVRPDIVIDENIECANCRSSFTWREAFWQDRTPGSETKYGSEARTFCPSCGALMTETEAGSSSWAWVARNDEMNQGKPFPPSPIWRTDDLWWLDRKVPDRARVPKTRLSLDLSALGKSEKDLRKVSSDKQQPSVDAKAQRPVSLAQHIGGFGEPYCSQACSDEAGTAIAGFSMKRISGPCRFCGELVAAFKGGDLMNTATDNRQGRDGIAFVWEKSASFCCKNCVQELNQWVASSSKCFCCGGDLQRRQSVPTPVASSSQRTKSLRSLFRLTMQSSFRTSPATLAHFMPARRPRQETQSPFIIRFFGCLLSPTASDIRLRRRP